MNTNVTPKEALEKIKKGEAILVDVRTPAEYSEVRAISAINLPLDKLTKESLSSISRGKQLLFICRSGKRGEQALSTASSFGFSSLNVTGGTLAWDQDGLAVVRGASKVISLDRQVRIAAGALVAIGSLLVILGVQWAIAIPLFVGCGLIFAGVTDTCGLAMIVSKMPWNTRGN